MTINQNKNKIIPNNTKLEDDELSLDEMRELNNYKSTPNIVNPSYEKADSTLSELVYNFFTNNSRNFLSIEDFIDTLKKRNCLSVSHGIILTLEENDSLVKINVEFPEIVEDPKKRGNDTIKTYSTTIDITEDDIKYSSFCITEHKKGSKSEFEENYDIDPENELGKLFYLHRVEFLSKHIQQSIKYYLNKDKQKVL